MRSRIWIFVLAAFPLLGSDFQTGQAARAVLGQPTFTSRDSGFSISSLSISGNRLFAADSSHRVFTFDVSKLPDVREDFSARQDSGCSLCGFLPVASSNQSVMPGIAAFSVSGKTVALADVTSHRVLIWRDTSSGRIDHSPDVVLGRSSDGQPIGPATLASPVSVATDGHRLFVGDAALHRVLVWNSLPTVTDQPADAVLGQPDFFSSGVAEALGPDSVTLPSAMVFDGSNLFVSDFAGRRILVFSPVDQPLSSDAVINSASFRKGAVAPGTLVTVKGKSLSEGTLSATASSADSLSKQLGGTELILDGQALPLLAVSAREIQAQIPYDIEGRTAASLYVRTVRAGGAVTVTAPVSLKFETATPGIFAFGGTEPRGGVLLHGALTDKESGFPVTEESPAQGGEVLTVWATGLGAVSENSVGPVVTPVRAEVNGQPVSVLSARLPEDAVGVYEVKIALPALAAPRSRAQLTISQNNFTSNAVTFPLASPLPAQNPDR